MVGARGVLELPGWCGRQHTFSTARRDRNRKAGSCGFEGIEAAAAKLVFAVKNEVRRVPRHHGFGEPFFF
ncbi:hypothetical protein D3C71_2040060 [compost metagenome]